MVDKKNRRIITPIQFQQQALEQLYTNLMSIEKQACLQDNSYIESISIVTEKR